MSMSHSSYASSMIFTSSAVMQLVCGCFVVFLCLSTTVSAGFFDKRPLLITRFKYESCDPSPNSRKTVWVKEADVMTTAYGDLDVLGTIVTGVNLTAPIKASVSLRRKILGLYIPLPCIREFGSCDYPDLCLYGYNGKEDCPPIFDEHDVPCRCPIKPGVYNLPGGQFQIPRTRWARILAGEYKGIVKFFTRNIMIACYNIFYTLDT